MITKICFGTKELIEESDICRTCQYKFACNITLRRRYKEEILSLED